MKIEFVLEEKVSERFGDDVAVDAPDGLWVPTIVCDHCSETVETGYEALLLFRTDPGAERGVARAVHRDCAEPFRRERPGDWRQEGLNLLPVQIANILHPDPRVAYDLAERKWSPEPELIGVRP